MTPFGRQPVTAGLLASKALAEAEGPAEHYQKWELFRHLVVGRAAFGVTDRDLAVLNALLTFHRSDTLDAGENLIVFPSNASLSERAHGMAESTLRRHLAALVKAGLILRHDSPNGKRYAKRDRAGGMLRAFGFDLRPLLSRATVIVSAAEAAREAADRLKAQRERCVLMLRDLAKLIRYGEEDGLPGDWEALGSDVKAKQTLMRRQCSIAELEDLEAALLELRRGIETLLLEDTISEKTNGNDSQNERHQHNSKPTYTDFEPSPEKGRVADNRTNIPEGAPKSGLPLGLIKKACPEILMYNDGKIEDWHQLVATAGFVRGMLGISADAWSEAVRVMGDVEAATTVSCILERAEEIKSPGGYLRALTLKSADGRFSSVRMVMALLNTERDRAA